MLTREQVTWGYRILLEREPELHGVVEEKTTLDSLTTLVRSLIQSDEFKMNHPWADTLFDQWVMVEHALGFRIWVNLADVEVSWAILRNNFETASVSFVKEHVKLGHTAIDIGANVGFFALLFSRLVGERGRVIGFEPLSFLYEAAVKSVRENGFRQCTLHPVALAEKRGTANLVYAPQTTNWGGAFLALDGVGLPGHRAVSVPLAPLVDYLGGVKADFIKIDVEGAEHVVLKAARDYLATVKPVIMSEIHSGQLRRVSGVSPGEFVRMMQDVGYSCHAIWPDGEISDAVSADEEFFDVVNVAFMP